VQGDELKKDWVIDFNTATWHFELHEINTERLIPVEFNQSYLHESRGAPEKSAPQNKPRINL
jgi:hypothetical protein